MGRERKGSEEPSLSGPWVAVSRRKPLPGVRRGGGGGHTGTQTEEPEMHQEAVNPRAGASRSTETSAKSHSPTPTLIKDAFVYTPWTVNRDAGKEKCSLVGHSKPRK